MTRTRRLEDGALREEVAIESYSAEIEVLDIELGLGVDMADIFEVRGYPRAVRGTLCPVEVHDDRIVFAYDGLDATRRTTTVTLKRAKIEAVEDPDAWPGASVVARWNSRLRPGRRLTIAWVVANASEPSGASDAAARARGTTGTRDDRPPAPRPRRRVAPSAPPSPVRGPARRFGP